jgi:hypothetical protein
MEDVKKKENPHSVKFSVNAKGLFSGECKVYAESPEDALTKACEIAKKIEEIIKIKNNL